MLSPFYARICDQVEKSFLVRGLYRRWCCTMTDCDDDNDGSCTWASLIPTSFNFTLYIPLLKISVTAGSFIRYTSVGDEAMPHHVGRVIEIVASEDLVPGPERPQLLQHVPPPNQYNDDRVVVQYAKVNIFKDS